MASVVAACRVRVAVNGAHRARFGIDVMAIAVELALAKIAGTTKHIDWHQHRVAHLDRLDRRSNLLDHARKFLIKGRADLSVGHLAVVRVQIGAADAGPIEPHNRVVRMFDIRREFLLGANPVRASLIHCQHGVSLGIKVAEVAVNPSGQLRMCNPGAGWAKLPKSEASDNTDEGVKPHKACGPRRRIGISEPSWQEKIGRKTIFLCKKLFALAPHELIATYLIARIRQRRLIGSASRAMSAARKRPDLNLPAPATVHRNFKLTGVRRPASFSRAH